MGGKNEGNGEMELVGKGEKENFGREKGNINGGRVAGTKRRRSADAIDPANTQVSRAGRGSGTKDGNLKENSKWGQKRGGGRCLLFIF
jgi:hypothetical protein